VADVELITEALAAGATALLAGTGAATSYIAKQTIHDAYARLRSMLRERFAGRDGALRELDAEVTGRTQPEWQARIGKDLHELRETLDDKVFEAAHDLLRLTDPERAATYNLNTGTSSGFIGNNKFNAAVHVYYGHPPVPATD
jgi:hypothetical protein